MRIVGGYLTGCLLVLTVGLLLDGAGAAAGGWVALAAVIALVLLFGWPVPSAKTSLRSWPS